MKHIILIAILICGFTYSSNSYSQKCSVFFNTFDLNRTLSLENSNTLIYRLNNQKIVFNTPDNFAADAVEIYHLKFWSVYQSQRPFSIANMFRGYNKQDYYQTRHKEVSSELTNHFYRLAQKFIAKNNLKIELEIGQSEVYDIYFVEWERRILAKATRTDLIALLNALKIHNPEIYLHVN